MDLVFFQKIRKGIIHIGANLAQERMLYAKQNLNVLWIEPIPEIFVQLCQNIRQLPNQQAINALLSNSDGEKVPFFIANNKGQSSSIFPLKHHKELWPSVGYIDEIQLATTKLDTLMIKDRIDPTRFDALVIDTQGAELLVLQGAIQILLGIEFIWVKVSDFEAYQGGCTASEVDEFLTQAGFQLVSQSAFARRAGIGTYYNAFYSRKPLQEDAADKDEGAPRVFTFGDSYAVAGYSRIQINGKPIRINHLGSKLMHSVGRDGLKLLDISRHGVSENDTVIFSFGEIDCRCHVGKFSAKWQTVIDDLVERYIRVVLENKAKYKRLRVIVMGIVPPASSADVANNPDFPFIGSDEARIKFVRYMNKSLENACVSRDLVYMDVYTPFADGKGLFDKSKSDGNVHIADANPLIHFLTKHLTRRDRDYQESILESLSKIRPQAIEPSGKVRVGNEFDGGYVIPSFLLNATTLLSIGVGGDVSFDLEFARRGANVYQFDHTVAAAPEHQRHPNCKFWPIGWLEESKDENLQGLDTIVSQIKADGGSKILKFDVEGCEYQNLAKIDESVIQDFDGIICELHFLDRLSQPEFKHAFDVAIQCLTRFHTPVHLHANNFCGVAIVYGIPIPRMIEITFVRRDLVDILGPSSERIPSPLDNPNNPNSLDICLNLF